jgi:hypothetical protein
MRNLRMLRNYLANGELMRPFHIAVHDRKLEILHSRESTLPTLGRPNSCAGCAGCAWSKPQSDLPEIGMAGYLLAYGTAHDRPAGSRDSDEDPNRGKKKNGYPMSGKGRGRAALSQHLLRSQ